MRPRHEYVLTLAGSAIPDAARLHEGLAMRTVDPADLMPLADLMLDAYRNTIDYEGESMADAVTEAQRYFSSAAEEPGLLGRSVLLAAGATLQCACLVQPWPLRQCPLVAYIVCRPASKRQGLASIALAQSLRLLQRHGCGEVRAVITEGNVPSERLFSRAGFRRLAVA